MRNNTKRPVWQRPIEAVRILRETKKPWAMFMWNGKPTWVGVQQPSGDIWVVNMDGAKLRHHWQDDPGMKFTLYRHEDQKLWSLRLKKDNGESIEWIMMSPKGYTVRAGQEVTEGLAKALDDGLEIKPTELEPNDGAKRQPDAERNGA